ncbi:GNAT family N-acetyltransferase [Streptomyces violaceusniger]|uniref:GCN5-related N-acetyltransferase n=1 Tax=Streptomyces violaceusniger (strain Tu 4113) TaxID=653045 RepID=G2PGQ9_STRV4|nr:GNAT family N-acetyltransferase [Streptomyces violaceusniger]AEM88555.1 GCN5-related N-acetyltransferase [Streptomyces violaceusniger Tu 4113]
MGKRTTKKGARPAPLTADRLRAGWPGPADTRIRLARAQDAEAADTLLATAGVGLIPALRSAIEDGTAASLLLEGLGGTTSTFFHTAARAFVTQPMPESMSGISLPLVAVDQEDRVVGVLSDTAPGTIINMAMEQGYEPPKALAMGVAVAKVHGLAVAETARRQGLAAALLKRACQVYDQLGYLLIYGSYETDRDLAAFYTRCGYTVLDAGQGVSLQRIDIPFGVHAGPHEHVFTRWRPRR